MSGEEVDRRAADGSPGDVLAQARASAGLTQREVSDALHLPLSTVVALELDDTEQLPAHVFIRGYVRAYAKLLDLDPDPLVAALSATNQAESSASQDSAGATEGVASRPMQRIDLAKLTQPKVLAGASAGVVLLLLIWALTALLGSGASDESGGEVDPLPLQIEDAEDEDAVVVSTAVAVDASTASSAAEVVLEELPQAVVTPTAAQESGQPQPRRLTEFGEDRLSFIFTEECWVEIKDTAGTVLFGDLGRAGRQIELVGAGPFRVLLGYAPGVVLKYNSEPVALSPHTRNNVASLVLGQ